MNKLVTFGVVPKSPETGYGYIKATKPFGDNLEGFDIESFIEKPDIETAQMFLKDKRFSWNRACLCSKPKR